MNAHDEEMTPYRTSSERQSMPELRAECRQAARKADTVKDLIAALGGPTAFTAKMQRLGITFSKRTVETWHTGARSPVEYTTQMLILLLQA